MRREGSKFKRSQMNRERPKPIPWIPVRPTESGLLGLRPKPSINHDRAEMMRETRTHSGSNPSSGNRSNRTRTDDLIFPRDTRYLLRYAPIGLG